MLNSKSPEFVPKQSSSTSSSTPTPPRQCPGYNRYKAKWNDLVATVSTLRTFTGTIDVWTEVTNGAVKLSIMSIETGIITSVVERSPCLHDEKCCTGYINDIVELTRLIETYYCMLCLAGSK